MKRREKASVLKDTSKQLGTRVQLFEYPSVRYWSKEINGTRTVGRKRQFFISRPREPYGLWRPRQLNPVNPRPRGVPGVAKGRYYTRASAYTARAAASIGGYI